MDLIWNFRASFLFWTDSGPASGNLSDSPGSEMGVSVLANWDHNGIEIGRLCRV